MSATVGSRAVSGLRWTLINTAGERILSFGTTMVLARMLDPEHFGLYALAFVVIDTFQILKNLGLDAAIIQRRDRVEEAADTAFLVLPFIGLALFGLLFVLAPLAAHALGNPEVGRPLQALGAVLILRSIGNVPAALIQKQMRFDIRTIANLTGMVIYMAIAVTLARRGWGVWSLVVGYLVRWLVTVILQWVMLGWVPRWRFDKALLKEMVHFSKYVVATWLVSLFMMNVDKISVGRWMGAAQLGYYTLCLGLANIMVTQLSGQIYQVAFPAFSQAYGSPELMRRGLIKVMKYLSLCAMPFGLLLSMAPSDILHVAYGPQWVVAAPLLQVLAFGGVLQTLRLGLEPVQLGGGYSKTVFMLNVLQLILLTVGAVIMARQRSPLGVAWAVVVAAFIPLVINLQIVLGQVGLKAFDFFAHLKPVVLSSLMMAGVMFFIVHFRAQLGIWAQSPLIWIISLGITSLTVYGAGLMLWDRAIARELFHLIRPPAETAA